MTRARHPAGRTARGGQQGDPGPHRHRRDRQAVQGKPLHIDGAEELLVQFEDGSAVGPWRQFPTSTLDTPERDPRAGLFGEVECLDEHAARALKLAASDVDRCKIGQDERLLALEPACGQLGENVLEGTLGIIEPVRAQAACSFIGADPCWHSADTAEASFGEQERIRVPAVGVGTGDVGGLRWRVALGAHAGARLLSALCVEAVVLDLPVPARVPAAIHALWAWSRELAVP